jgi:hypothetical protein
LSPFSEAFLTIPLLEGNSNPSTGSSYVARSCLTCHMRVGSRLIFQDAPFHIRGALAPAFPTTRYDRSFSCIAAILASRFNDVNQDESYSVLLSVSVPLLARAATVWTRNKKGSSRTLRKLPDFSRRSAACHSTQITRSRFGSSHRGGTSFFTISTNSSTSNGLFTYAVAPIDFARCWPSRSSRPVRKMKGTLLLF